MKRDANEKAIISALRMCGFLVQQIDQGGGVPDLLVCAGGRVVMLEVKDGPKKKLTPAQQKWHAQWEGAPVFVVDSVESALAAVQDIDPQVKRVRELEARVIGMMYVLDCAYGCLEHLPDFEQSALLFGIIECLNGRDPMPAMEKAAALKYARLLGAS